MNLSLQMQSDMDWLEMETRVILNKLVAAAEGHRLDQADWRRKCNVEHMRASRTKGSSSSDEEIRSRRSKTRVAIADDSDVDEDRKVVKTVIRRGVIMRKGDDGPFGFSTPLRRAEDEVELDMDVEEVN